MEDSIIRAALGTTAKLGDLYNAKKDNFPMSSIFKNDVKNCFYNKTEIKSSNTQLIHDESFSKKIENLNISAELKYSLIGGLLGSFEGSGKYLNDSTSSQKKVKMSLISKIITLEEEILFSHEGLENHINEKFLNGEFGTHVVARVIWGGNCVITTEYKITDEENYSEIQGSLSASLQNLANKCNGKIEGVSKNTSKIKQENMSFKIFGDILPEEKDFPKSDENIFNFISKVNDLIKASNNGRGRPMSYTLLPISDIRKKLNLSVIENNFVYKLPEEYIYEFMDLFDEIHRIKEDIEDINSDLKDYKFCIPDVAKPKYNSIRTKLKKAETKLQNKLAETLDNIRSMRAEANILENMCEIFKEEENFPKFYTDAIEEYIELKEKINLIKVMQNAGVVYIEKGDSLNIVMDNYFQNNVFILFYKDEWKNNNLEEWQNIRSTFLNKAANYNEENKNDPEKLKKIKFIFADVSINPKLSNSDKIYISYFIKGKCIANEITEEFLKLCDFSKNSSDKDKSHDPEEIPGIWEDRTVADRNKSIDGIVSAGSFAFPGYKFLGLFGRFKPQNLEILVGRVQISNNQKIPGKFIRFKEVDIFCYPIGSVEVRCSDFQVLKIDKENYKWVTSSNGKIEENAVLGGFEKGENLYIGRVYLASLGYPNEPSIGKISSSSGGCTVPYWSYTYFYKEYEILVKI